MTLSPTGPLGAEAVRARLLVVTRRRATALLAVMAGVFLAAALLGEERGVLGFVQAGAEASLVGGLADWFAVTALFRHPVGLPIPHTAVIPKRKDQFGATLGHFVEENLLTPALITERIRDAAIPLRVANWLADERQAALVAGHVADAAASVADVLAEDDVARLIEEGLRRLVDRVEPGPLAARALAAMMDAGYHQEAFDAVLRGAARFLDEHHDRLEHNFVKRSPRWTPGLLDRRIFAAVFDTAQEQIAEILGDPGHRFRTDLDVRLAGFVAELETSPALQARIARAKDELMAQGHLPQLAASLWRDARATLAAQAAGPSSELRSGLAAALAGAGRRLRDDPALRARGEQFVETAAAYVVDRFHGEIGSAVNRAINSWDGEETARRLELLLGPDLQFIRINGTVIGGLAGLAIHAVGMALS